MWHMCLHIQQLQARENRENTIVDHMLLFIRLSLFCLSSQSAWNAADTDKVLQRKTKAAFGILSATLIARCSCRKCQTEAEMREVSRVGRKLLTPHFLPFPQF